MDGKFAAFIAKFKEFFLNLSSRAKKLLAIDFLLLLVFASAMVHFSNNQPYEGHSKSDFTYGVFKENKGHAATKSERESYKLLDLQKRLVAAIVLFDGVKDAEVTIALDKDGENVSDSPNTAEATASVVVIMEDGGSPTEQQVEGIQRLVSKSTPNIALEDVIVTDGNEYNVSMLVQ